MNRRLAAVAALAAVFVVALWWVFVYSPLGSDLSEVQDDIDKAADARPGLDAQLRQLEEIAEHGVEIDAELAELMNAVPEAPDLAEFIDAANQLAFDAGITWLSIAPSEPIATGTGPSTIQLTMQIDGGFFQVVDYLNRLEDLDRAVIVDAINIATSEEAGAGGTGGTGSSGGSGFTGAPDLSVTLTARMFTLAPSAATPVVTIPGDASTSTTAPASDASTTTTTGVGA